MGAADRAWGVGAAAEGAHGGSSGAPVGLLGHRDGHFLHTQESCQSEQKNLASQALKGSRGAEG